MKGDISASDLSFVIPTRDRWPILARTLAGLRTQTAQGFEVVVVVDGTDQDPPERPDAGANNELVVLVKGHGGPGAARNAGARAATRRLVLFLGDDMVPDPDLVQRHLDGHRARPEDGAAVLGGVRWHPGLRVGRIGHWLEWSRSQFDFPETPGLAGFWHFYSCNVSLKRAFFLEAGGFDEAFTYYYEDLDCAHRLDQKGMTLYYDPAARTGHLHSYDWASLERRFRGVAEGERLMASMHPWFRPFFLRRVSSALDARPRGWWWTWAAEATDRLPTGGRGSRFTGALRRRADERYHQRLAPAFLAGWWAAEELDELRTYLGEDYDHGRLVGHMKEVARERSAVGDDEAFYRCSQSYLYDLTAFAMSGTKAPYLAELLSLVPPGGRILDYGCGIGSDGLRLARNGFDVSFADYRNPSTTYLNWRLARRGLSCPVYDIDRDALPGGFAAAFAFDVIEHVADPFSFLQRLERQAAVVAVNFLEEEAEGVEEHGDGLHHALPIAELLDHAARCGIVRYRLYHGRSHLVVYRSPTGPALSRLHSRVQRSVGTRLARQPAWFPLPTTS